MVMNGPSVLAEDAGVGGFRRWKKRGLLRASNFEIAMIDDESEIEQILRAKRRMHPRRGYVLFAPRRGVLRIVAWASVHWRRRMRAVRSLT